MEITITRALKELNLLEKKITKITNETVFVTYRKKGSKIDNHISDEDFAAESKSKFTSVNDLIEKRRIIKRKILESNAVTKIKINDMEMTVADAIELKDSIKYEKCLLEKLRNRLNKSINSIEAENAEMEMRLDTLLNQNFNKEKADAKSVKTISEEFKKTNEWILINPINVDQIIVELDTHIDKFENEVDYALSESNTLNKIIV